METDIIICILAIAFVALFAWDIHLINNKEEDNDI